MVSNHYIDHIFCLSCKFIYFVYLVNLVKRKKMEPGMFYLNLNNMHLLHCLVHIMRITT